MRTVGLCLIIKNEKHNLEKLLSSVKNQVDWVYLTDTGSTDGSVPEAKRVCERLGLKLDVSEFEWVNNFSKARNFNFKQAKTDWVLWLDGDDTFEGEGLRDTIKKAEEVGATGIYMTYKYFTDKAGNEVNDHPKLRVVKNGYYSWTHETAGEVPLHENLFPLPSVKTKEVGTQDQAVKHWMTEEDMEDSQKRNIMILRELEKSEGNKPDPRTVFLIGRELNSHGDRAEAVEYLKKFLGMNGLDSESLHACSMISKYYETQGKFREQLTWAYRGISYHPKHPLGYLNAAEAYRNMGRWEECADLCKQALEKKIGPAENLAFTEFAMDKMASIELANAYNEMGEHELAIALIKKLEAHLEPEELEKAEMSRQQVMQDSNITRAKKAINMLANSAIHENDTKRLAKVAEVAPNYIMHTKPVLDIKRSLGLNKLWPKGSIVIYATVGLEEWDEDSLKKGIGGSETAVIEMAKRFGKAGYHVTVYGDVNDKKVFDNVTYIPAPEVEWADEFDIFISWRNVGLFKKIDIKANKKFLWLHDVPVSNEFYRSVYDKIDKIIVLSDYHRNLLPDVPDEKFYISRNGIDTDLMDSLRDKVKRKPKRVIYASQPIRGLEFLLDSWAVVKESDKSSELVWAYGWDNYDIMIERGVGDQGFKDRMNKKMHELGVKQLGRLSKEELYREFLSSDIWAYPTEFPEINCIVASEAQYAGCYPISTGLAALQETQVVGDKVALEEFAKTLVERLDKHDSVDYKKIKQHVSWNTIANEWMNDLFYGVEWEDDMPLVSVIHITGRHGGMRMLRDALAKQTYQNIELVIIDKLYSERADEVADYMSKLKVRHIHLPDSSRDRDIYRYGLCHAHNSALFASNGELLIFLQDFFDIPEDGIERFVELYKRYPDVLLAGVDRQYSVLNEVDKTDKLDIFKGKAIEWGKKQWESMWMKLGKGRRVSVYAREWEANWGAAPRKVLEKLGGWNTDWDKGFGWDNVEIAFRHCEMGGQIIVDEGNIAKGVRHENDWQTNMAHSNGQRFLSYAQAIQNTANPNLIMKFKEPKYNNSIRKKIYNFKKNI